MIQATVGHESDAIRWFVSAGANMNLQNQVRTSFQLILHCTMYHIHWLSILGGSYSSDDLGKKWGDRAHRYSPNWRKH